jgi:threonine synthase
VEFFYHCSECSTRFDIDPERMVCPDCSAKQAPGEPLRGILEVGFTAGVGDSVIADHTDPVSPRVDIPSLLPVGQKHFPSIPVGNTPLWRPRRLREQWKMPRLFIKDDTANPTGSLKDRASILVAAFAKAHGFERVVVASTGNAACSMAGVGAAAGLKVTIFVPATAPRAKLIQALQYGATVVRTDGDYDQACEDALDHVSSYGGLSRNTGYNPLTIEGKKTVALEIYNQLGRMPDHVFVPVGDGVILCGVYKGFEDLYRIGVAERIPTIHAVQAAGSDAIARALATGNFGPAEPANTVADSISVSVPAAGHLAVTQLTRHNGSYVVVEDGQILDAQHELARTTGLFAEPAAAAAYAGFRQVASEISSDAVVVLLVTGSGLKDIDAAEMGVEVPA